MKAARRRLSVNRKRDQKAMSIFSKPVTALVIAAALAGVYLYGRSRLHNPVRPAQASRTAALPPERPAAASPPAVIAARTPAETATAEPPARMTPAQQAGFDAWLVKTYLACWKPPRQPADSDVYVARVRLAYNPDGSLMKPAKLVNPPSDPALKPEAKSVMAAVENCNPLTVPAQYRPFYEQWKTKTIHFDPQVAAR
jgi:hypothetical protein